MSPRAVFALAFFAWLLWRGYTRRRGIWTAQSWRRFGLLWLAVVGTFAAALAMAYGVDHGVYEGMPRALRRVYFGTLMALVIAAPLAGVALAIWSARGRPERQLWREGPARRAPQAGATAA